MAAVILSSLIPPTTLTFTSGWFLSYSATMLLNALSSRALQPTQIVMVSAFVPAWAALRAVAPATAARTATSTTAAITPRLIRALLRLQETGSRKGSERGLYGGGEIESSRVGFWHFGLIFFTRWI